MCNDLIEAMGVAQTNSCAMANCPMKDVISIDDVFEEFGKVVFALPVTQKPVKK